MGYHMILDYLILIQIVIQSMYTSITYLVQDSKMLYLLCVHILQLLSKITLIGCTELDRKSKWILCQKILCVRL